MTDELEYPETIEGSLYIVASGDRFPLVARLTDEVQDADGVPCRVYLVGTHDGSAIPASGEDFARGRVGFEIDVSPAQSVLRLPFMRARS